MVWHHKDMLILNGILPPKVLTELTNSSIYTVHSWPATVTVKFKLPPRVIFINIFRIELTKMKWKPVEYVQDVGFWSYAESWNVFIYGNQVTVFCHSKCSRRYCSITASARCCIRWLNVVLSMMTIPIPCVSDPHNTNEQSFFVNFVAFEMISLLL